MLYHVTDAESVNDFFAGGVPPYYVSKLTPLSVTVYCKSVVGFHLNTPAARSLGESCGGL